MKTINTIKTMIRAANNTKRTLSTLDDQKFNNDRVCAEVLRNVHSIEKGLSLRNVRPAFGYEKIKETAGLAENLIGINQRQYDEPVAMLVSAISSYLDYHRSVNYSNEKILEIERIYLHLKSICPKYDSNDIKSGTLSIKRKEYSSFEREIIEHFFYDRHSVREFSKDPVDINMIKEAVKLASRCPSACNRQGYRVHVVCKDRMDVFNDWFEGTGGFFDEIDKMLIITGKISTYRASEEMQYIVSASVFAGYLTLALHEKGIGSCFIQRPVVYSKKWEDVSNQLGISQDEQIVCTIGVGNLLDEYKVPVSYRLSVESIVTVHGE